MALKARVSLKLINKLLRCKTHRLFFCICIYLCFSVNPWEKILRRWDGNGKAEIVILMWTKFWWLDETAFLNIIYNGRKDSDKTCFNGVKITYDRGQLDKAAAIVIFPYLNNISDIPKTRRADQPWIHLGTESPVYYAKFSPNSKSFSNLFNWTMTYRIDSDIFIPYGEYRALDKEEDINVRGVLLNNFIRRKSRLLAGVISSCQTPGRREEFIKQLLATGSIDVDIFGDCGKPICSRWNRTCNHGKWWAELGANYKFYFAAENAICIDYVTEKFWRALEIGLVPLVYGGANYSRFAPPNSFIDVRDFKSAKDVAEFLRRLDKNDTEYERYFQWRKKYKVRAEEGSVDTWIGFGLHGWCELSKKVKEFKDRVHGDPWVLQKLSKTIHDFDGWWNHEAGSKREACGMPPI